MLRAMSRYWCCGGFVRSRIGSTALAAVGGGVCAPNSKPGGEVGATARTGPGVLVALGLLDDEPVVPTYTTLARTTTTASATALAERPPVRVVVGSSCGSVIARAPTASLRAHRRRLPT